MKKHRNKKPVSPIYAFGLVCLIYSLFFGFSGAGSLIKCVLLAVVVSLLVKSIVVKEKAQPEQRQSEASEEKPQPHHNTREEPSEDCDASMETETESKEELNAVVRQGRLSVKRIQELNDEIPDYRISAKLKQIEILTASIINQVEQKEEQIRHIRQFMNYYLPTTIHLLEKYVQLQNVGLKGDNISEGMRQIDEMLDKVIVAFQKELDGLFERDVIDITADIQVMEQMMAAQGLTNHQDFKE